MQCPNFFRTPLDHPSFYIMKTMVDGELVTLTLLDTAETHAPTDPLLLTRSPKQLKLLVKMRKLLRITPDYLEIVLC